MNIDKNHINLARDAVSRYSDKVISRLNEIGLHPAGYHLELTACGNAEGPEFEYRDDCVYLEQITVYKNSQGLGGKIMRTLLETADDMGMLIVLEVASQKFDERNPWWMKRISRRTVKKQAYRFTALSQEELEAWYQRLGFIFVSPESSLMKRLPKSFTTAVDPRTTS